MRYMRRAAGFTLIELLVVIVIMGIVIGSISLTLFDSAGERLEQESRRLLAVIGFAQEQAAMDNRQFALSFTQHGYRFFYLSPQGEWLPYDQERIMQAHDFAEPVEAEVYIDGIKVALSATEAEEPQVFILSSGEMQPFSATLYTDRASTTISGDTLGKLTLERDEYL